ncbi:50S ribosomal protein L30 [Candidatus Pacearchaeota archaeon]|nr:50S ribosomal protein L30 [Candidatus Pacearchaeota archaeon]
MEEKTKKTEEKKEKIVGTGLLAVIRIDGMIKVKPNVNKSLDRLRLRRKYCCVLVNLKNKDLMGMVNTAKFAIAFGEIEKEMLVKLLDARGKSIDKKEFDSKKIAEGLLSGNKLTELGLKPFFRLHPPRKGIKSKLQYPKGVLGNNHKDINKLLERML